MTTDVESVADLKKLLKRMLTADVEHVRDSAVYPWARALAREELKRRETFEVAHATRKDGTP